MQSTRIDISSNTSSDTKTKDESVMENGDLSSIPPPNKKCHDYSTSSNNDITITRNEEIEHLSNLLLNNITIRSLQ